MHYMKRSSVVSRLSKRSLISEKVRILRRVYSKVCQPVYFFGGCEGFVDKLCTARRRAQCLRDRIQSILADSGPKHPGWASIVEGVVEQTV